MAADHDERRRLARLAAQQGWTVRQTEARAREAGGRRASAPGRANGTAPHPDQIAAARRLSDALGQALGTDVKVAPRGSGYRVTVDLDDPAAAAALADRLEAPETA
jgi:ParB family chromosome partitioning protein